MTVNVLTTSWKQLYKIAGLAFMAGGTLPTSGKTLLDTLATQGLLIQITLGGVGALVASLGFYFISITWPVWFIPTGIQLYRPGKTV